MMEDTVKQYLKEIDTYPLLTSEQELALCERMMLGDQLARKELVLSNLRLVVSIAKRYVGPGIALLDLVQEGNIALIRAVDAFDFERGVRFGTYATWGIREAVSQAAHQIARTIYLSERAIKQTKKINESMDTIRQSSGREPLVEEIAQAAELSRERVLELLEVQAMSPSSLADPEYEQLADTLEDTSLWPQADIDLLGQAIAQLDDRERTIIEMRFGLIDDQEHSPAEVGSVLRIAERTVQHHQRRALQKLRAWFKTRKEF